MEAVSTSETSIYYTTRRNIPEDFHLHTGRQESLKSHKDNFILTEAKGTPTFP